MAYDAELILAGKAVELGLRRDGLAILELKDTEKGNGFTPDFISETGRAMARLSEDPAAKAVLVHCRGSVFCSGGTKDELMGIYEGRMAFSDLVIYKAFLDCPLPVVAAMQGHSIGGGLVFGLYADLVYLAEERLYSANFMDFGFTPGMGATCVLKERFGSGIANHMLFTGGRYFGRRLKEMGVPLPVLPAAALLPEALRTAAQLADKPRTSLLELKRTMAAPLREVLPAAIKRELAMHAITFPRADVRERIEARFGGTPA